MFTIWWTFCFQFGGVMNKAIVSICILTFVWSVLVLRLGKFLWVELCCMIICIQCDGELTNLPLAVLFYVSMRRRLGVQLFHITANSKSCWECPSVNGFWFLLNHSFYSFLFKGYSILSDRLTTNICQFSDNVNILINFVATSVEQQCHHYCRMLLFLCTNSFEIT